MHVRRVGNNYMKKFFCRRKSGFFLFWNTNALFHLFAKFKRCPDRLHHHGLRSWKTFRLKQAHGFVPRYSAHPLGSGCDRFCSALCRSSRCDALPGGSRLLSVPGDSGADSYTSQSKRGALPGTYTHVKKAPGFIRLSLCTRRSAASASTDTGTDMPALSRMQNITRSLKICFPRF